MKKSMLLILLCLMFFTAMPVVAQDTGTSKGFTFQVYTDLQITPKTQLAIELDSESTKLSSTVQGGENITIDIYSNNILVGRIENGVTTYAIDFMPENSYAVITGNPHDIFDITFTFED